MQLKQLEYYQEKKNFKSLVKKTNIDLNNYDQLVKIIFLSQFNNSKFKNINNFYSNNVQFFLSFIIKILDFFNVFIF